MPQKPTLFVLLGPTAVGKTAIGIELAQQLDTEILSADSRQIYAEMSIGTAKPNTEQLGLIKHHFIGNLSIHGEYNAGIYENDALLCLQDIFSRKASAVMVGGTGLYINAVCNGLDELPKADAPLRKELQDVYEQKGMSYLQEELRRLDPGYFQQADINNPHRLMRAIEVCRLTGKPYSTLRKHVQKQRPFHIIKMGLELPREELYKRINHRVDLMMEAGLLEEARQLWPFRHLNALQTVGYSELFDHLGGKTTLDNAITLIKQNTRRYAKRQMTWFRQDKDITWFSPNETSPLSGFIGNKFIQPS